MTSAQPDSYAKGPALESNAPMNPGYQLPIELHWVNWSWRRSLLYMAGGILIGALVGLIVGLIRRISTSLCTRIANDATGDLYPRVTTPIGPRGIGLNSPMI
ncbi:hypothetical protein BO79DRAFT_221640 [Aspergillus costaricaensis CBS 115574]|uniref:Uncharacterized protein n=1 Tax=Aspergillus costaricaensis CBS 115574 TaxID=1448317 RepID=A0ACD1I1W1_9EURO|nr:hypothetical protein BO79DRAFT_221640 [Aspergillus costaricaensis CBS 115574]RAK84466.1 hypothetical protein BO79DRAFT_221640 [Aspergillus costaricaensis CBS 115574]